MTNVSTRIAPTPSGWLHPGNGISFLVTWALARATGAGLWLRIDDLDADRMRPEYVEDIFRTLDWLGIDYDHGPSGPDDFFKRFSQHLRLDLYQKNLEKLRESGLLYACNCSRKEIRDLSPDGRYPGTCRDKGLGWEGDGVAWRVRVAPAVASELWRTEEAARRRLGATADGGGCPPSPLWGYGGRGRLPDFALGLWRTEEAGDPMPDRPIEQSNQSNQSNQLIESIEQLTRLMGDFVVRQKNGMPAYQIASLTDDLLWGINFIVRGADLLESTAAQLYLAHCLGEQAFFQTAFLHHPLVKDEQGEKLSKSKGAGALKTWRENGLTPAKLVQQAAGWLGLDGAGIETANDLLKVIKGQNPDNQ